MCHHIVVLALHSAGLRWRADVWLMQVGLSRQILLSNPAANVGWVNLLLSASLSILLLGACRVGKKVCTDNGCNLEGLFVSLSELACRGGTNCRTRLQFRGPHKQSCLLLKLNSLTHDLGTAGQERKGNTSSSCCSEDGRAAWEFRM